MIIKKLLIKNLRIIKSLNLIPTDKINLITGENGAGKTTILESIYMLARNKSFRTKHQVNLILENKKELIINGLLLQQDGVKKSIGIKKTREKSEIHVNGERVKKLSDLAKSIPIGIITPNVHKIFDSGPSHRRKFINWGLFHVEQNYAELMRNYQKVLSQRNADIKQATGNFHPWDAQLSNYGEIISSLRNNYIEQLSNTLNTYTKRFSDLNGIQIKFKQGWSESEKLIDILRIKHKSDSLRGYTQYGAHRADLDIIMKNKSINETLSRGQIKIVGLLLIFSQLHLMNKLSGEIPILLFDEIKAELDQNNLINIIEIIDKLDCQAFLTTINKKDTKILEDSIKGMFHVEHGELIDNDR